MNSPKSGITALKYTTKDPQIKGIVYVKN